MRKKSILNILNISFLSVVAHDVNNVAYTSSFTIGVLYFIYGKQDANLIRTCFLKRCIIIYSIKI